MKKIYFYSTIIGLGLGAMYISMGMDLPLLVNIVSWLLPKGRGEFTLLVVDPIIGLSPLILVSFVSTLALRKFVPSFSSWSFFVVFKINLFFLLGIILSLIYLGLFVRIG